MYGCLFYFETIFAYILDYHFSSNYSECVIILHNIYYYNNNNFGCILNSHKKNSWDYNSFFKILV
jgi:hypothetical protein